jgi:DHA3 family macrolide efflux protein-like MFS transporter
MNPICNGPLSALVQSTVAPEMQGRVMTLVGSAAGLMSPLSLAIAGPLSDALGIQAWFVAAGILSIIMAGSSFFIRAVMHVEDDRGRYASSVVVPATAALAESIGD